ncbi:hypothetical protein NSERUTF1_6921 [Nocardia seriolae]|nr:hypothetical protein NSERUTF1_6921 [Nocardia seriolae]
MGCRRGNRGDFPVDRDPRLYHCTTSFRCAVDLIILVAISGAFYFGDAAREPGARNGTQACRRP